MCFSLYLLSKFVWVLFFTGLQSTTVDKRVTNNYKESAELGLIHNIIIVIFWARTFYRFCMGGTVASDINLVYIYTKMEAHPQNILLASPFISFSCFISHACDIFGQFTRCRCRGFIFGQGAEEQTCSEQK